MFSPVVLGVPMFDGQSGRVHLCHQVAWHERNHHSGLASIDVTLNVDPVAVVHVDQRLELSATAQRHRLGETQAPQGVELERGERHHAEQ